MKKIILMWVIAATAVASAAAQPSDKRFSKVRRGINLSHWYAQAGDASAYTKKHIDEYNTEADIKLIRSMGFDHVRLGVDPGPLFDANAPGELNAEWLGYLNASIRMILANDLAVIVDIHPAGPFNRRLDKEDSHVRDFALFWKALAKNLSGYDPDRVFLEVVNEPEVTDAYRWMGVQQALVDAIRAGAPQHTIIVTGPRWSGLPDLLEMYPVADDNVIYNFHYYEPMMFTHQGATWAGDTQRDIHRAPYPSNPDNILPFLEGATSPAQRLQLVRFAYDHWNAERVEADFAQVAAWQKKYGVRVTVNEFGVYEKYADPSARVRYLHDVRSAAEKFGFGWAMWDYAGGFGVVTRDVGKPAVPQRAVLKALGLEK
jgi:aryl-phospho-beta-D-glucosidase BglC (GH1 family)